MSSSGRFPIDSFSAVLCGPTLAYVFAAVASEGAVTEGLRAQARTGDPAPELSIDRWLTGEPFSWSDPTTVGAPAEYTVVSHFEWDDLMRFPMTPYLNEMALRGKRQGVRVLAVVHGDSIPRDTKEVTKLLRCDVAVDKDAETFMGWGAAPDMVHIVDVNGTIIWAGFARNGPSGVLKTVAEEEFKPFMIEQWRNDLDTLESASREWWDDLQPSGPVNSQFSNILKRNPHAAVAWAARVAYYLDVQYDPQRAMEIAREATAAMANQTVPLTEFIDRLLRIAPGNQELLQLGWMALVPIAPVASEDPLLQMTYLRALVMLGREREALRIEKGVFAMLSKLPPTMAFVLAETLVSGQNTPDALVERAQAAIQFAEKNKGPWRELSRTLRTVATCYEVERAAGEDGAELFREVLRVMGGTAGLNNQTWYFVTDEPWRGRFLRTTAALGDALAKEKLQAMELDTLALVRFRCGRVEDAVTIQQRAVRSSGSSDYTRRLKLFESVVERQPEQSSESKSPSSRPRKTTRPKKK